MGWIQKLIPDRGSRDQNCTGSRIRNIALLLLNLKTDTLGCASIEIITLKPNSLLCFGKESTCVSLPFLSLFIVI
jgi:hypothetical protein